MSICTVCVRNMSFEGTLPLRVECSGTNVFYRNMIYYSKNKVPASTRAFLRHICLPCQYVDELCFQSYQYKFLMRKLCIDQIKEFRNCLSFSPQPPWITSFLCPLFHNTLPRPYIHTIHTICSRHFPAISFPDSCPK